MHNIRELRVWKEGMEIAKNVYFTSFLLFFLKRKSSALLLKSGERQFQYFQILQKDREEVRIKN